MRDSLKVLHRLSGKSSVSTAALPAPVHLLPSTIQASLQLPQLWRDVCCQNYHLHPPATPHLVRFTGLILLRFPSLGPLVKPILCEIEIHDTVSSVIVGSMPKSELNCRHWYTNSTSCLITRFGSFAHSLPHRTRFITPSQPNCGYFKPHHPHLYKYKSTHPTFYI